MATFSVFGFVTILILIWPNKPQFMYCKIDDLLFLKTLLKTQAISLTTDEVESG